MFPRLRLGARSLLVVGSVATLSSDSSAGPPPWGAPGIASVQVSSPVVVGGTTVQVTVTLDAKATQPEDVILSYSSLGVLGTAPKTARVGVGSNTVSVPVATIPTATSSTVKLTATLRASSQTTAFTVRRPEVVAVSPTVVQGGANVRLTLTVDGDLPDSLPLSVTFAPPLATPEPCSATPQNLSRCSSITPDPKRQRYLWFGTAAVRQSTTVAATARVGASGTLVTSSLQILQPQPSSIALQRSCNDGTPITDVTGPANLVVRISMPGVLPPNGAAMALTASVGLGLPPGVTAPSSVEMTQTVTPVLGTLPPPGSSLPPSPSPTYSFGCAPVSFAAQSIPKRITFTASGGGSSVTTSVLAGQTSLPPPPPPPPPPAALSLLTITDGLLDTGSQATGRIFLTQLAGSGGATVSLTSSDPGVASPPLTVFIAANTSQSIQFSFPVVVPASVSGNVASAIITASFGTLTRVDTVFVRR